jgi:hypothetical protein
MKLIDSLRRSMSRDAQEPRPAVNLAMKITREKERLHTLTAGRLDAEIRGLDERMSHMREAADPRDLAELIALSALFVDRFKYRPLQTWAQLQTLEEAQLVFASTYSDTHPGYSFAPGDKSWREHLLEFARALHLGELFDDPLRWLIAWRPSEPREHATKIQVLKAADLGTLTNLLMTVAEWEIEQYNSEGHAFEPDMETAQDLWQGLTDTREMRLAIVDAWCRHPRIPVDYIAAIRDATPERQLDFIATKVDALMELGRLDALEKTGTINPGADDEPERFSLYS